jgi:hypothetical protein
LGQRPRGGHRSRRRPVTDRDADPRACAGLG